MNRLTRTLIIVAGLLCAALLQQAGAVTGLNYIETPLLADKVGSGEIDPVGKRLPVEPRVIDL